MTKYCPYYLFPANQLLTGHCGYLNRKIPFCLTKGILPCDNKKERPDIPDWFRDIYEETNRRLNEST